MTNIRIVRLPVITILWAVVYFFSTTGYGQSLPQTPDTSKPSNDSLRFPISDRRGDRLLYPGKNPFDLKDPANIRDSIIYDPKTKEYYRVEKIGNRYYRKPTPLSFDEYMRIQSRKAEADYFRNRANTLSLLNRKLQKPKLNAGDDLFNRLFGNGKIDIRPQGEVNITAGYQGQNVKNPTLPERARRNGGFDFDMAANINVIGNIGDKLKMPISYNTLANFDFDNQLKLDYTGTDDEIIKRVEVGNTNFASKGTLIPGAQQLFGIKTQMQFGKFWVTGVFGNQRSQRQSVALKSGSGVTQYAIKADEYEENRHFLLTQYFRKEYNNAMKNLPFINSQVQILRLEVWVTNRTGATTETRDVVGLMDLAENQPYQQPPVINPLTTSPLPFNGSNDLYQKLAGDPNSRNPAAIVNKLIGLGLQPIQDFEKTFARKLDSTQYIFNRQLGFLSLNVTLQPDEVLGVAFQYTYNGRVYQVGEFSQDVPVDSTSGVQKVLFLKLLKATSQRTALPIWDLMMKNVYSLGFGTLERQDFQFNILYQEPGGGEKRYVTEGDQAGIPLITLLNLDRLNNQNDPQPDGVFDYVEGYTVFSNQSRIVFPILEPFGHDLDYAFTTDPSLRQKYLYYPLYDTIKAIAQTYANLNRFIMRGTARSSGSNGDIPLNAFNIPQGSVTVTAGGQVLQENVDYTIDYVSGSVRIINEAIKKSGIPINVNYENNATFGVQQRTYLGLRWDYLVNKKLSFGGTIVRLSERPFFTKMEYGTDPIRNTMMGLDFNYQNEFPRLNKWLDKLPFYTPNGMSSINAFGEFAQMKPGHAPQIGKGSGGLIYIDDFEGTKASIDLRFPLISWTLASTPKGATDVNGNVLFPEADLFNSLDYGKNRSKLAWYNIEPILQERKNPNNPLQSNLTELSDPRVRSVSQQEIFPQRTPDFGQNQLVTFDLSYYPKDKGPYNYEDGVANLDANGKLTNPRKRWGGIMRGIDQTDFETANIEFIEFWILDPFIKNTNPQGGTLYFNLGNISEDVLKDSRRFYENGIETPTIPAPNITSTWGKAPLNPIQVTQAFSNDPADRPYQDVGFDGLQDSAEATVRADYLSNLRNNFGAGSKVYQDALADPSNDNFRYYRDASYNEAGTGILGRYKHFNNPHGNSPVATAGSEFSSAFTLYPDNEDLNRDNTLNEAEEYFQYRVQIKPSADPAMQVGQNFIVDRKLVSVTLADGTKESQTWYQFRVPVSKYDTKVGKIPDFKSIRFIRMFLTDFEDSTTLRFAKLELVRNNWRRFTYEFDTAGMYKPIDLNGVTPFNVSAANIEENDKRIPIPYRIPPGIERVQALSNGGINILQNEQALSMVICNLEDGQARGVFKTVNYDLRQYKNVSMFVHAESSGGPNNLSDNELYAVVRIGNDFISNFYEIKYPLKVTPFGTSDENVIWPEANNLDIDVGVLVRMKQLRNLASAPPGSIYRQVINGKTYSLVGNPNLGEVRGILVGVENLKETTGTGRALCTEVWINELRLSGLNEQGGYAAVGQVNIQLSDLGTFSLSGGMHTIGFGTLEQRVNDRFRDDFIQFDAAANLQLGKLLPKKAGLEIPFYASFSQTISSPEYDPYDLDIKLKDKYKIFPDKRDSIRNDAIDVTTIKTINFTNVRKSADPNKKVRLWSISNFDFSYNYTVTKQHNPLIENNEVKKYQGGIGYTYNSQPKYWEPLKQGIKSKTKWLDFIRDFNLNPNPNLIGIRWDLRRQFGAIRPRNVGGGQYKIPETYDKYFVFDRIYNMRWDLTRSFNIDFKATNNSRIDEPFGRIDNKTKKDSLRQNLFKGGRNTLYNQNTDFTYNLPTSKFPFLDWTTASLGYKTTYGWIGASRLVVSLGNTIQNSNQKVANVELNFTQLYLKSKLLRTLDQQAAAVPPPPPPVAATDTAKNKKGKVKRERKEPQLTGVAKAFAKLLTSVKRAGLNYSEGASTFLPGYVDSTQFFGQNWKSNAPGFDFIFGKQPDSNWLKRAAAKGLITKDPLLNNLFRQTYDQRISLTAQLEPVRDLTIDINMDKTLNKNYNSLFKDTTGSSGFSELNPYSAGGFSISYISFQTLFKKFDPNQISETFKTFENNRLILSKRLGDKNPYNGGAIGPDGYYVGYGRYAQEVLIPAFLAAYTNKDPNSVSLLTGGNGNFVKANPYSSLKPKPNWRITYNGLTRIKPLDKIFTNFTISHGYNSTLSMNSFNSALLYQDSLFLGYPSFIDTISGNFVPYFLIPNISISEQFSPLISIDFATTGQFSGRFEYKKSRQLSLSLIDYQLSEVRGTEYVFSARWRKRGFTLPFKIKIGKKEPTNKLENDISFQLDFSIRDDVYSNSRLDQANAFATGGQKVINIQPSIDYVMSNRVRLKLYFDQRRVNPYISSSAPLVNTRAGVQVNISLAQ